MLNKFKYNLLCFFLSLSLLGVFFNEAFKKIFLIDLNIITFIILIIYFSISFISYLMRPIKEVNLFYILLVLCLFISGILIQTFDFYSKKKLMIFIYSFLLSIIIIFNKEIIIKYYHKIINFMICVAIFGVIISIQDYERLIIAITLKSRMIYDASPISISSLLGILFISLFYSRINSKLKYFLLFLSLILMIIIMSRGPIVALFMFIFIYYVNKKNYTNIFFMILISILVSIYLISSRGEHNISDRFDAIFKSLPYINDNIWGYGVGAYSNFTGGLYPHNIIIEFIFELGILFTIIYLILNLLIAIKNIFYSKEINFYFSLLIFYNMILVFSFSSVEMLRVLIPVLTLSFFTSGYKFKRII